MKSILEELYRGELYPSDKIVSHHPEFRALSRQRGEQREQWREKLGDEMFQELERYFDLCATVDSLEFEAAFIHGFRLGANMMIEVVR